MTEYEPTRIIIANAGAGNRVVTAYDYRIPSEKKKKDAAAIVTPSQPNVGAGAVAPNLSDSKDTPNNPNTQEAQRILGENGNVEFAKSRKSRTFVPTSKVPEKELAVAHQALFAKVQDQAEEGTTYSVYSANYYHVFDGNQHQYAIPIVGNESHIDYVQKGINNGTYKNTADLNRWDEGVGSGERYDNHSNASAPRRRGGDGRTDILYQRQSTDTQRNRLQSVGDSGSATQLRTPDGVVYGYAQNGNIYLTEQGLNPNTPIHEYTHLWGRPMQQKKFCKGNTAKIPLDLAMCKKSSTFAAEIHKPHRSSAEEHLFGRSLKGNRVQIPSSPAAVSLL